MRNIEAVIFDAGGVLRHESGPGLHRRAAQTLGIDKHNYRQAYKILYPLLSTGRITDQEFWEGMRQRTGSNADVPEDLYLQEHIADFRKVNGLDKFIRELHEKGIRTALLSNSIASNAAWDEAQGLYDLLDPVILSHEVGLRKPDPSIYHLTLEQMNIQQPGRVVFIDDKRKNVMAARSIGMQGIVFRSSHQLKKLRRTT